MEIVLIIWRSSAFDYNAARDPPLEWITDSVTHDGRQMDLLYRYDTKDEDIEIGSRTTVVVSRW